VIIEDSNFNYHINISKLEKTYTLGSTNTSTAKNPVKKGKFTSSLLNEIELGMSFIPSYKSFEVQHGTISDRDHMTETFLSYGSGSGFYAGMNLNSKKRIITKSEKVYFGNSTQLKFNTNMYQGEMEYREIFAGKPGRPYDSVGQMDTFRANVTVNNLYLVKRLVLGTILNSAGNFSVECGMDIGVKLSTRTYSDVFNTSGDFNERVYNWHVLAGQFVSNPTIIFYPRLGINYKKFTLNTSFSAGKIQMGTHSYKAGRMVNIGLAFRLR
jgi:hypothetical protein